MDHPTTTFTYSGLEPETTYSYRVSAVDDEGNEGDRSDPDSATTQAEPVDESFDGTWNGNCPTDTNTVNAVGIGEQFAADNLQSWWGLVIFWPVCHILLSNSDEALSSTIHCTVDLLGNRETIDTDINLSSTMITYMEAIAEFTFLTICVMLLQAAVVAINIFDIATTVNPANPYAAIALGVALGLTILAYIAPVWYIETSVAEGWIDHGTAAAKYSILFLTTLLLFSGRKSLINAVGDTVGVLLGVVLDIHLMGAGIWLPWLQECYEPRTKWGSLIILGAAAIFAGLALFHIFS